MEFFIIFLYHTDGWQFCPRLENHFQLTKTNYSQNDYES
jgi:hypothetical protein